ncbi:hypothetical protein [Criblamydia sequanensis]|uniref:Uncharacterized protein n=1 Tax=Candidatus Criblamydia sequanensis CRIB-18 TaxID=1437425 RepID=A0A090D2E9_9BACT|nr:hypothetical protein [Criblamydia sequanensis]CDR34273.1 hypothetical protein CSEC_1459 [Criblamydia sequanensis CRIB-18]
MVISDLLFFKANKIKTALKTLKNLPTDKEAYYDYPSGKIVILPKSSLHLLSQLRVFYHVSLRKNWKELARDLEIRISRLSNALSKRIYSEKENFIKKGPNAKSVFELRKKFHAFFDLIEDLYVLANQLGGEHRKTIFENIQKIYIRSIKENEKILKPLHFFTESFGSFQSLSLESYQNFQDKPWDEKISILSKAGYLLAEMISKKKELGEWASLIDLDGKMQLFFNTAKSMLFKELKEMEQNPKKAESFRKELTFLNIYLESLQHPDSIGKELSYSLNHIFQDKEALLKPPTSFFSKNLSALENLVQDAKEKLKVLEENKEKKEKEIHELQDKLKIEKGSFNFKSFALDTLAAALPKTEFLENVSFQEELKESNQSIQILTRQINEKEKRSPKELQEKLFQIGLLKPSLDELNHPEKLLASESLSAPFEKALSSMLETKLTIEHEIYSLNSTIAKIEENINSHIALLKYDLQVQDKPQEEKENKLKMLEKDAALLKEFDDNLEAIKQELSIFNSLLSPLLITEEEAKDLYHSLANPIMSEGAQGELPKNLEPLKRAYESLIYAIKRRDACILTPLLVYKLSLESKKQDIESIYFMYNEKLQVLKTLQKQSQTPINLTELLIEKEIKKLGSKEIETEIAEAKKNLHYLEGIKAVLITLTLVQTT